VILRKRRLELLILLLAALGLAAPVSTEAQTPASPDVKIDAWLLDRLQTVDTDSFLVLFDRSETLRTALASVEGKARPAAGVYELLRTRARTTQDAVRRWLDASGIRYRPLYIVNGLEVSGSLGLARSLAARREVVRVVGNPAVRGIETSSSAVLAACGRPYGVTKIRADQVWSLDGARGEGVVVASSDTGVQWDHPALIGKYRGWDGQAAHHDFNWHDAIQDLAEPLDDNSHGTHTTGTMVGEDAASGEQIGVAPGAKWIACRNMDHGVGRPSTYLDCNQYFLAPYPHGGNPETDGDPSKAPDVTNNSWGCPPSEGCDPLVLEDSFAALQAAGILPVAAAGNSGFSCATVTDPPAIYREAFVAGATDSSNTLAFFSSRGPVTVDGSNRIRPDVSAPGVSVCSSVPVNAYATFDGTSMASPHTAGAAALLWSARPQLKNLIAITRCVLSRSANSSVGLQFSQSCGGTPRTARPNNMFGWGLVDAYGAVHYGPDGDGDGVANPCDCAASNAGAYAAPGEVHGVGFADRSTVQWDSLAREAGNGTVYDLVRGSLGDLRGSGSITSAVCVAGGASSTSFVDTATPMPDQGYYFLVQGRNTCGSGGWGTNSAGALRTHANCP
jgi:subtilisin family serine protease